MSVHVVISILVLHFSISSLVGPEANCFAHGRDREQRAPKKYGRHTSPRVSADGHGSQP